MKHPRTATNNVMKIIDEDGTDVLCIQEPNVIPNKIAGIPRKHKIYASGEERHRAAIVVTNNQIDFLLLRQLSDEDTVVLEVVSNKARTIIASIADTLAKAAATNLDIAECYNKVPKSLVKRELEDRSVDKWQRDGNRSTKGKIIKDYYPTVAERLKMKITDEDGIDVLCIQEPYVIHNKIAGIPRKHKIYASGEGRHRAAIVITNNQIDSLLLRQLSDEDSVVLEVVSDKAKTIAASMYFDLNRQIEGDLIKIEAIIHHAKKLAFS